MIKKFFWVATILLILVVTIYLFNKFLLHIIPKFQNEVNISIVDYTGYHLTLATFIVTFLGILFVASSAFNIYSRHEARKEMKKYKQKIDDAEDNINFLKESSNSAMQAILVLLVENITRHENLSKEKTQTVEMENKIAVSVVNLSRFLIPHISAKDINKFLLLLVKIPNKYILSKLDDIKDDLLRRCEKDSKFKSDAVSLIPDTDKIHPFKRQIESLKEIIEDAIKNDEQKYG